MEDRDPPTGVEIGPGRPLSQTSSRRTLLLGVGAVSALGALGAGGHHLYRWARPEVDPRTVIPLYSQTVAYDGDEQRILVGASAPHHDLSPSSRLTTAVQAPAEVVQRSRRFWDGTATWRSRVRSAQQVRPAAEPDRPRLPEIEEQPSERRGPWRVWPTPRSMICGC